MANFIPVMSILVAFIIIANEPSYASADECILSNIEVLSQLIDERINVTFSTLVAEFTTTLERSIATTVNTILNTLSDTVDTKIATVNSTVSALSATVDERMTAISATADVHDVSISKLLSQPGMLTYAHLHIKKRPVTVATFSFVTLVH